MKKVLLYATATETLYFHITFYRLTMWFATEGTVRRSLGGIHKITESKLLILVMKILEKETLFIESHWMSGCFLLKKPNWRNVERKRNDRCMSGYLSILLFVQDINFVLIFRDSFEKCALKTSNLHKKQSREVEATPEVRRLDFSKEVPVHAIAKRTLTASLGWW